MSAREVRWLWAVGIGTLVAGITMGHGVIWYENLGRGVLFGIAAFILTFLALEVVAELGSEAIKVALAVLIFVVITILAVRYGIDRTPPMMRIGS
jgi:uncharacterized membrane protein